MEENIVVNDEEETPEEMNLDTEVTDILSVQEIDKPTTEKLHRLPLARVKTLMKLDPDVHLASQEATFLITKATVVNKI